MRHIRVVLSRLRGTISKRRLDEDLDNELKFHIEMLIEERIDDDIFPQVFTDFMS